MPFRLAPHALPAGVHVPSTPPPPEWPTGQLQARFRAEAQKSTTATSPRGYAALLLAGDMRPVSWAHLTALEHARARLEKSSWAVLGSWLAPTADLTATDVRLRLYLARLAARELSGVECSDWLSVSGASLAKGVRALQDAVHGAVPELEQRITVFVVSDVEGCPDASKAVNTSESQGVILVPRHGDTKLVSYHGGVRIRTEPLGSPIGQYTGMMVRAVLLSGEEAVMRYMLPGSVARALLEPTNAEQADFGQELAGLAPAAKMAPLLQRGFERESELARPLRESLRAWLVKEGGGRSLHMKLTVFDMDADGCLDFDEVALMATQAGIQGADVYKLLRGLGLTYGSRESIAVLADRIEGDAPGLRAAAAAVAKTSAEAVRPLTKDMRELAVQAATTQAAFREQVLQLVDKGGQEEKLLRVISYASWKSVFLLKDSFGSSLLLLSSGAGMEKLSTDLVGREGPNFEERRAYADGQNEMGWTPLQLAAQNGHCNICKALLDARADANFATRTGLSPLMLASSNGHEDTVKAIIAEERPTWTAEDGTDKFRTRADLWQTSADGRTALDFVRERIKKGSRLATDHVNPETPIPDLYGVRAAKIAPSPNAFNNIERLLEKLQLHIPLDDKDYGDLEYCEQLKTWFASWFRAIDIHHKGAITHDEFRTHIRHPENDYYKLVSPTASECIRKLDIKLSLLEGRHFFEDLSHNKSKLPPQPLDKDHFVIDGIKFKEEELRRNYEKRKEEHRDQVGLERPYVTSFMGKRLEQLGLEKRIEEKVKQLTEWFQAIDKDNTGSITFEDYCRHRNSVEVDRFARKLDIELLDLNHFFDAISSNWLKGRQDRVALEHFVVGAIKFKENRELVGLERAYATSYAGNRTRCNAKPNTTLAQRHPSIGESMVLFEAAEKGFFEVAQRLLQQRACVNQAPSAGVTPLYIAAQHGQEQVVDLLLRRRANVDRLTATGFTPLYIAAENGYAQVVQSLLAQRAFVARVCNGWTPLQVAEVKKHDAVANLLRRALHEVYAHGPRA